MSLTALEVLEVMKEMCETHGANCDRCKLIAQCNVPRVNNPKEIVEICEKWREKHNVKTYADVFFELHPNAQRWDIDERVPIVSFYRIHGGKRIYSAEEDAKKWLQPYPKELEK